MNEPALARDCCPATLRDWLAAQLWARLSRLDRFSVVRKTGERIAQAIAGEILIPSWDARLFARSHVRAGVDQRIQRRNLTGALHPGRGCSHRLVHNRGDKLLNGDGMVISFEPDARNYALLRRNILLNGSRLIVRTEQLAIAETESLANLHCPPTISTRSSFFRAEDDAGVSVRCISLDHYPQSNNTSRVEFLKLDLEGAEPICIEGMEQTLRSLTCLILGVNDLRLPEQTVDPIQFAERGGFGAVHVCDEQQGKLVLWEKGDGLKHPLPRCGYTVFSREAL